MNIFLWLFLLFFFPMFQWVSLILLYKNFNKTQYKTYYEQYPITTIAIFVINAAISVSYVAWMTLRNLV